MPFDPKYDGDIVKWSLEHAKDGAVDLNYSGVDAYELAWEKKMIIPGITDIRIDAGFGRRSYLILDKYEGELTSDGSNMVSSNERVNFKDFLERIDQWQPSKVWLPTPDKFSHFSVIKTYDLLESLVERSGREEAKQWLETIASP